MEQQPESHETGATQRVWMERAKLNAELARQEVERPLWPRVVGLALSLALVAVVLLAFDSFLTALGRYLDTPIEAEAAPVESPQETPMPVFVVPEESSGQDEPAANPEPLAE